MIQWLLAVPQRTTDIRLLDRILADGVPPTLAGLLVTPVQLTATARTLCYALHQRFALPVYFDSGGYAVQTGRLAYETMVATLRAWYHEASWGTIYTLPDDPPTSHDPPAVVAAKVTRTVAGAAAFYATLPATVQARAMGVVQGHTLAQIEYCVDQYVRLGLRYIGFGGFDTFGQHDGSQRVTRAALRRVQHVIDAARAAGAQVHLFGVGAPAILPWLIWLGAASFDSATWLRSAAYGQVFLPGTRAWHVAARRTQSQFQRAIDPPTWQHLRHISGHQCRYCQDWDQLTRSRAARAGHNIWAIADTLHYVAQGAWDRLDAIYHAGSPRYRQWWRQVRGLTTWAPATGGSS